MLLFRSYIYDIERERERDRYIYIYIYIYIFFFFFFFFELTRLEIQRCSPKLVGSEGYTTLC